VLYYDREEHLMPLLRAYCQLSFGYGEGTLSTYDLRRIQEALANDVLAGKRPLLVSIRHFQFAGELQSTGLRDAKWQSMVHICR
jgi:hypothetical protein